MNNSNNKLNNKRSWFFNLEPNAQKVKWIYIHLQLCVGKKLKSEI